jgi:TolB-like protein
VQPQKEQRVERRLAAIFAADDAGYSRLMSQDEAGTLRSLAAAREIMDGLIAAHGGRIANTAGDSVLAEFPSAVDAVQCAVAVQEKLGDTSAGVPEDRRLLFRIGLHVGDVVVRGRDLLGDGVNIAARLEALCEPGGICISDAAHRHVRKALPLAYTDLGEQHVKNIDEPVRVFAVKSAAAAARPSAPKPLPLPDKPSIAVLPFTNMSGELEQEYFGDGLVEDIITALSRFRGLFVIARNSSFTYEGIPVDVRRVGRELGVRYVLEGSVRKAGNRLRITGQLIEAATGAHVWADRFDGALEDVFELQDRITQGVIAAIVPTLEQAEVERARRKPTGSLDAYDCYLRGLAGIHASTLHGNQESDPLVLCSNRA